MPTAYLDTCIISGLAKEDLAATEMHAMINILQLYKEQRLTIVTSTIAKSEIDQIPTDYRNRHSIIYQLLSDIPISSISRPSMLMLMGVGGGGNDPIYDKLKLLLPDENDILHLFQAIKGNINYFVTVDRRTILSKKIAIESKFNIKLVSPTELLTLVP